MTPRISILSRDFQYVPASQTDIRKTFERVRAQQITGESATTVSGGAGGAQVVHHFTGTHNGGQGRRSRSTAR